MLCKGQFFSKFWAVAVGKKNVPFRLGQVLCMTGLAQQVAGKGAFRWGFHLKEKTECTMPGAFNQKNYKSTV